MISLKPAITEESSSQVTTTETYTASPKMINPLGDPGVISAFSPQWNDVKGKGCCFSPNSPDSTPYSSSYTYSYTFYVYPSDGAYISYTRSTATSYRNKWVVFTDNSSPRDPVTRYLPVLYNGIVTDPYFNKQAFKVVIGTNSTLSWGGTQLLSNTIGLRGYTLTRQYTQITVTPIFLNSLYVGDEEFMVTEQQDRISFTVDEDNCTITAKIENPSDHTKYLISQGRCYIAVNCRAGGKRGKIYTQNNPRHGLGRVGYRFHPYWAVNNGSFARWVNVTNVNQSVTLTYNPYFDDTGQGGIRGFARIKMAYDIYQEYTPWVDIRLCLLNDSGRVYSSKSNLYRIYLWE